MKFDNPMQQALRLTQAGDLQAATRTIQQALGGFANPGSPPSPPDSRAHSDAPGDCVANDAGDYIDGEFFVVDDDNAPDVPDDTGAKRGSTKPWSRIWPRAAANPLRSHTGLAPTWIDDYATGEGDFQQHHFICDAGQLHYKLYIPPGLDTAGAPLLLMLHGCTQTPDDFARGTRMNELAVEQGYVVAWPAQSVERNQNRCWNWFRGGDQQRDQGEPAILAALTRQLVTTYQLDAKRIYVAGLSAGGAMAAVLA
ncbi:MAG: alpha/beta hydrolase family esterase, partial [Wenzhouxiangella sp.]